VCVFVCLIVGTTNSVQTKRVDALLYTVPEYRRQYCTIVHGILYMVHNWIWWRHVIHRTPKGYCFTSALNYIKAYNRCCWSNNTDISEQVVGYGPNNELE
jgi:hypothetical protein